jgi:predicted transcriptional regulator
MGSIKSSDVLNAISDDLSLELFKLVALTKGSSEILRSKMDLTRKQYYSRLHRLVRQGLIAKKDNHYSLTTLGTVLHQAQATIESALTNYWRIKAVDSIGIAEGIPLTEQKKMIENLIKDQDIMNILIK